MNKIITRLKSPVLWVALLGLIYSAVLVPAFPQLPEWTAIAGYICTIFGVANNPTDRDNF